MGATIPRRRPACEASIGVIAGIVLAAGSGSRFGAAKQLAELDGTPLLEHALRAIEAVPAIDRVLVVLGARAEEILAGIDFGATGGLRRATRTSRRARKRLLRADRRAGRRRPRARGAQADRRVPDRGGRLCSDADVDTPEALERLRG